LTGGDLQVSVGDLGLASPDYVALGHIHKSQQKSLPYNFRYAGSPYHQNTGELEEKGFFIITFGDSGELKDIEFIKTPCRPMQVIEATIVDGQLVLKEDPFPGADIEVRIRAPKNELHESFEEDAKRLCAIGASTNVKTYATSENNIRTSDFDKAKNLSDEFTEYCHVKAIKPSETAIERIHILEEAGI
jgi:DNA repair exonuclease SbcCD nuclease subunit